MAGASSAAAPLLLVLLALALTRLDARVDVVRAVLVHEEHLPPITGEPTYTLARFVQELLKMQGDELYSNAIPGSFKRRPQHKSKYLPPATPKRPYLPPQKQPRAKRPPPQPNVRINNNNGNYNRWPHTQVIFHPIERSQKLLDVSSEASTFIRQAEKKDARPVMFTSPASAASSDNISMVTAPALINENLIEKSVVIEISPNSNDTAVAAASALQAEPPTTRAPTTSTTTTTDIIDVIRRELKARRPSPRPFIATAKTFKKRQSQWDLMVDSANAKRASKFNEKSPYKIEITSVSPEAPNSFNGTEIPAEGKL